MNKYKVGDKVVILESGQTGKITDIDCDYAPYLVEISGIDESWFEENELTLYDGVARLQDALSDCTQSNADPLEVVTVVHRWFHENYEWKRLEVGDELPAIGSKVRSEITYGTINPGDIVTVSFHGGVQNDKYGKLIFAKPIGAFWPHDVSILVKKSRVKYIRLDERSKCPEIGSKVRIEDNFVATSGSAIIGNVYKVVEHSCFDTDFLVMGENGELTYVANHEVSLVVEE